MLITLVLLSLSWCPEGKIMSGGMGSSGAIYTLGCRTPQEKTRDDLWFQKMWSGELGIYSFGGLYTYSHVSEWLGDRCFQEDQYKYKGKPIAEEQYYKGTCGSVEIYSKGVWSRKYPKSVWKHCSKRGGYSH